MKWLSLVLLAFCLAACSGDQIASGGFGPVSASGDSGKYVSLIGLTKDQDIVVMASVDFSEVAEAGLVPDKQTTVETESTDHGQTTRWVFPDSGDVEVAVTISLERARNGGMRVRVNEKEFETSGHLLVRMKVRPDGGTDVVGHANLVGKWDQDAGFEGYRKIYGDTVASLSDSEKAASAD
ncbi:MAG: hypothetical protein KDB90_03310 [Planctomycetes bacterium]|nr:hypothetical protein [Planctomycetota bacterium]